MCPNIVVAAPIADGLLSRLHRLTETCPVLLEQDARQVIARIESKPAEEISDEVALLLVRRFLHHLGALVAELEDCREGLLTDQAGIAGVDAVLVDYLVDALGPAGKAAAVRIEREARELWAEFTRNPGDTFALGRLLLGWGEYTGPRAVLGALMEAVWCSEVKSEALVLPSEQHTPGPTLQPAAQAQLFNVATPSATAPSTPSPTAHSAPMLDSSHRPGLVRIPGGDVFAVCHLAGAIDEVLRGVHDLEHIGRICREAGLSAYEQEAVLHRFATRSVALGRLPADVGIPNAHPLHALREWMICRAEMDGRVEEAGRLVIWGASARTGATLYRELGTLIREQGLLRMHRALDEDAWGGMDVPAVLEDWARFSGVTHATTLQTVKKMTREGSLHRHPASPAASFACLDRDAVEFARRVTGSSSLVGYYFFLCLSRIAKYESGGKVQWRSSWFRGEGGDRYAIPGIGTHEKILKPMLMQHVLERVGNHCAGRNSRTYRLKVELKAGNYGPREAARAFGIELNQAGRPKVARGRARLVPLR